MNLNFKQLMNEAARLTRGGNLRAATHAIQSALRRGSDEGAVAANDPPPETRDVRALPSLAATDVEAREAPAGRFVSGRHSAGGAVRDYKLYVPPAAGSRPLPLVVMLHGCTQNPDDFAAGTAMNEFAQAQGFYVLYPAQSRQANPQACWNWFKHTHQQRGRGEPALLAGMTREVMAQHAIDPGRVYVAGLSAGGAMAAILAATYPDLYAAVGVHSGLAAGAAGDLPSALSAMKGGRAGNGATVHGVPTIVFHGDADATVHPANGEHVIKASAGAACTIETQRVPQGRARASTKSIYTEAGSGRVVAEHWLIHGTAHAWSGGRSQGSYTDSRGPDASAEMLRFFLEHPRQ
ncbi:MAG TPA: PHB depolymerase family esterase [Ramlibacter sp.]|jgi:poly(hydroxyalkanoate) depolymerase family esterase|nr:PHB depolymerase family esterase [Ramlibacter sp.]